MEAIRGGVFELQSGRSLGKRAARVKFGREFLDSQIQGYTAEVAAILGTELRRRPFHDAEYDVDHARNVCVIGSDIADNLFPFVDPIGKTMVVDDRSFEVIGVGTKQGSVLGQSRDNWAMIPLTLHQKMYGARRSVTIYAKALDEKRTCRAAESEIRLTLRARRHLAYNAKDDFALNTNDNFLQIWANISRAFFAVTIGIASISLIVGGIVVMNIMLVSVTERTREIGIRKASGRATARHSDSVSGRIGDAGAGRRNHRRSSWRISIALAISWFTPLPASIKWWAVALGLGVSTTVGLFFGIYPATKAANLDPIVALRYE